VSSVIVKSVMGDDYHAECVSVYKKIDWLFGDMW
jgi:hypothetical protein